MSLDMLTVVTGNDLLEIVLDTIRRHLDIWACMDVLGDVTAALFESNRTWKAAGVHVRSLVRLILEIDDCRFLDNASRQSVIDDAVHYAQVFLTLFLPSKIQLFIRV